MLCNGKNSSILRSYKTPLGKINREKGDKNMKTQKTKELLIEQLKKTPIIQVACEKTAVGRATYYRWKKEDEEFSTKADEALSEGSSLVSDIAESQLMSAIKDKNLTAIIFWLKHHHPAYATKVEVNARLRADNETLTPEQEALVT